MPRGLDPVSCLGIVMVKCSCQFVVLGCWEADVSRELVGVPRGSDPGSCLGIVIVKRSCQVVDLPSGRTSSSLPSTAISFPASAMPFSSARTVRVFSAFMNIANSFWSVWI